MPLQLVSEDGQSFSVDPQCLALIGIFKKTDVLSQDPQQIPIPNIKSTVMVRLVEWLEAHKSTATAARAPPETQQMDEDEQDLGDDDSIIEEDIPSNNDDDQRPSMFEQHCQFEEDFAAMQPIPWDRKFFDGLDLGTLIELTKAANYLDVAALLDGCCRTIANHMRGLTTEQLRQKFNIPNDLTPEQEAAIRREQAWCEE